MARKSFELSQYSNMLLNVILYSIFNEFAFAFPSYRESRQSGSLEKLTSAPNVQQVRCGLDFLASVSSLLVCISTVCCSAGRKTPSRSNRVCCDRYWSSNSSCCLHHPEILLSAEVCNMCFI